MAGTFKERVVASWEKLTPRTRQWGTVGAIGGAVVVVLWAAFAMGSGDKKPVTTATPKGDLKPTNIDLMAPGSQVREVDSWIGKAGKELEQYKADRDEQLRINRERKDEVSQLMRRFTELETKLRAGQVDPAKQPASAPMAPPVSPPTAAAPNAASGTTPVRFPPEGPLAQGRLPPQPPAPRPGAAMPPGAPTFDLALQSSQPSLVRVAVGAPKQADAKDPKAASSSDTFLPVSFTRGRLLGGIDAPTGGQAQSNPYPIIIMLEDNSVLPNRFRGQYKDCFVIAAAYGDISSERAYGRTESLSCVSPDGRAMEVKIQGSIFGEDGKAGMRGRLVTKQGQMLANALLAGVVSGIGQGISTANTTYSTTALGTVSTSTGSDAMKAGVGSGVGKALDRLAQYYIKLAEQTFPIIEIDAGREVDVVLTKGVRIESNGDLATSAPTALPSRATGTDRFQKVNDDED